MAEVYEKTASGVELKDGLIVLPVALFLQEPHEPVNNLPSACSKEWLHYRWVVYWIEKHKTHIRVVAWQVHTIYHNGTNDEERVECGLPEVITVKVKFLKPHFVCNSLSKENCVVAHHHTYLVEVLLITSILEEVKTDGRDWTNQFQEKGIGVIILW